VTWSHETATITAVALDMSRLVGDLATGQATLRLVEAKLDDWLAQLAPLAAVEIPTAQVNDDEDPDLEIMDDPDQDDPGPERAPAPGVPQLPPPLRLFGRGVRLF
jgi:hypothetical protein